MGRPYRQAGHHFNKEKAGLQIFSSTYSETIPRGIHPLIFRFNFVPKPFHGMALIGRYRTNGFPSSLFKFVTSQYVCQSLHQGSCQGKPCHLYPSPTVDICLREAPPTPKACWFKVFERFENSFL